MTVDSDGCMFRVLGPVQALARDGPIVFARRQQLDLLALLLVHTGQVLTVERIVDLMWGVAVPRTAGMQIKNMVSQLRGVLPAAATLARTAAGYRLSLADAVLDLAIFGRLVAQARAATDPVEVARLLRQALALWQGDRALGGVRAAFADSARAQLEEQRLAALEALFEAELECGRHVEIVAELTDAASAYPTRERLTLQLMTCLYRCGRATDALSAYRRARQTLVDEYGLEPGAKLRELERLILLGDTALAAPAGAPTVPMPAQLPVEARGFAGRADEIAKLNALMSGSDSTNRTVLITAIIGTAGVGKTALALHWAHQVAHRFPDGQLYVDLRGFDPDGAAVSSAEAIRSFLDALAVDRVPDVLAAQAALYRSVMAGRRMLVLLDNAVSAEQVRPLLPGTPGCLVLVTSRNRLTGLISAQGAHPLTLDLLSYADARDVLIARLGAGRVAREEDAAREIAGLCARLPLALAMVAARAAIHPTFPLSTFSTQLADVNNVFSWSYEKLSPQAAQLFRLLSLHPGTQFSAAAAASLVGRPMAQVHPALSELADAHLISEPLPGRFGFHDLLREYASKLADNDEPAHRRAAIRRLTEHYLHTADRAASLLYPHRHRIRLVNMDADVACAEATSHSAALRWFTVEQATLVAMVQLAEQAELPSHTWQLATSIAGFLDRRGHWHDWVATQHIALATATRHGDLAGQAWSHSGLGLAHSRRRDFGLAHTHLHEALKLLDRLGDRIGQAYTELRMTSVYDGWGDHEQALIHAQRALALYEAQGHLPGLAQTLNTLGWYQAMLGKLREAVSSCEQALALHRELGDQQGEAHTLDSLGYAYHQLGEFGQAAEHYRQSAQALGESGDRYYEAIALTHLGEAYHAAHEPEPARQAWKEGLHILQELGHSDADQLAEKLRTLDG